MDIRKKITSFSLLVQAWLRKNRLALLIGCILFFLIMYVNIPGFHTTRTDQAFGTVMLVSGLLNYTIWTILNKPTEPIQNKKRIKGKRK
ncbi:MAG TPA: hypothetical protein VK436_11665 [Methanocella sp.]|nr:hypothetical protein [Methanocella sp.]